MSLVRFDFEIEQVTGKSAIARMGAQMYNDMLIGGFAKGKKMPLPEIETEVVSRIVTVNPDAVESVEEVYDGTQLLMVSGKTVYVGLPLEEVVAVLETADGD